MPHELRILSSADATLSQRRRLIATGAKAYLTKPLDVSKMLALTDERLAH